MAIKVYTIYVRSGYKAVRKEIRYQINGRLLIAPVRGDVREVTPEEFLALNAGEEAYIDTRRRCEKVSIRIN
ncbi:MAG: hypothetical protein ACK518_03865 [bacterium]